MPRPLTPVLLATGNRDKQQEFRQVIQELPLHPLCPQDLTDPPAGYQKWRDFSPDETGETHESIARTKAAQWSQAASMLAIASDGGLVVPALGGLWESRYTHRFAGPAAGGEERLERLLELMAPLEGRDRQASWAEALAIAHCGRVLVSWELRGGTGYIAEAPEPKGPAPEFWAFTVWKFPEFGKTYDQMTPAEREATNDHWTRLRQLVRRYFLSIFIGRAGYSSEPLIGRE